MAPTLSAFYRTAPGCRVLFIADPDDTEELSAIRAEGADHIAPGGNYASKINAGVKVTKEALLFIGADDLNPHAGWLEAARSAVKPGIGLVGTQDLCNARVIRGEHATHFLMTREYAEQPCIDGSPGPLCDEYPHEFVDDEMIGTARKRNAYAFAGGSIVEHLHPDAGKAPSDALYAAQGDRMRRGRPIFNRRKRLWM